MMSMPSAMRQRSRIMFLKGRVSSVLRVPAGKARVSTL